MTTKLGTRKLIVRHDVHISDSFHFFISFEKAYLISFLVHINGGFLNLLISPNQLATNGDSKHITILVLIFLVVIFSETAHSDGYHGFLRCLTLHSQNYSAISDVVYTPDNSSYLSTLQFSIRNLRFTSSTTPRPLVIITPVLESQVQAVVLCAKENGMQIRTRSGGHDYEGLSYTSQVPFVVIDLMNLRACPTVGVGGHFSGGGYGSLLRKYGLAADNIIDARLIDVNGRVLDRKSMGKELFWAIRGGGGASFGVITAWKLNLVFVPETVTVFSVDRILEQNAIELIYRWQYVAPSLPTDLLIGISINKVNSSKTGEKTISASFSSLFLGRVDRLLELLKQSFPELGVEKEDCTEVTWIESAILTGGYPTGVSPEVLASRTPLTNIYFKAKSDYVREPIPKIGFQKLLKLFYGKEVDMVQMNFIPYGGRMKEIPESAIQFPHRAENLYKIHYIVYWNEPQKDASNINWIRRLYSYMTPYVSKFPRAAYINYIDLDLGMNNEGSTSYAKASIGD
ncbi:hypothetical protein DH2020_022073 [Rehmannia glutinosa]|uniref:FAD linked oxidase N-terminal domain-containing protein n=1 Tax=Rehmannia glutinosa TaxID=99300 RepID=A0ABR0WC87_REHGL